MTLNAAVQVTGEHAAQELMGFSPSGVRVRGVLYLGTGGSIYELGGNVGP